MEVKEDFSWLAVTQAKRRTKHPAVGGAELIHHVWRHGVSNYVLQQLACCDATYLKKVLTQLQTIHSDVDPSTGNLRVTDWGEDCGYSTGYNTLKQARQVHRDWLCEKYGSTPRLGKKLTELGALCSGLLLRSKLCSETSFRDMISSSGGAMHPGLIGHYLDTYQYAFSTAVSVIFEQMILNRAVLLDHKRGCDNVMSALASIVDEKVRTKAVATMIPFVNNIRKLADKVQTCYNVTVKPHVGGIELQAAYDYPDSVQLINAVLADPSMVTSNPRAYLAGTKWSP